MAKTENKMAWVPMWRLIAEMGLPMIVSMVLQALYNVIDSIFVANMEGVGVLANQALTIAFPIQILIIAIGEGLSFGAFKAVFFDFQNHASVYSFAGLANIFVPNNTINFHSFAEGGFPDCIIIFVALFTEAGIFADDDFFASIDVFYHANDIDPFLVPSGIVAGIHTFQRLSFQLSAPPS